jgi:hypothetical protein
MDRRALALVALLCLAPAAARGDAFVRVLTSSALVRTGPGADFREVHTARRGDVLGVRARGTRGYWLEVELDDGSTGWIFGEQVEPFDVVDDDPSFFTRAWRGFRHALLGPSPVPYADVELAFSAGMLGGDGLFLFRPAWLIDPYFALEGFIGESPGPQAQLLLAGLGWTLRLVPGATVGPYLHASLGIDHEEPKADAFALKAKTRMALNAGGGLEITLQKRITIRGDYRHWLFFDENEAREAEEVTGGLAIFF